MNQQIRHKLFWALAYCDEHDKSTEFMIQFMQDVAEVDFDVVIEFLENATNKERSIWYCDNPQWELNNPQIEQP